MSISSGDNSSLLSYVIALLIKKEQDKKKILFIKRSGGSWGKGYYALIGGKVEGGESPRQALVRELEEEVGIKVRLEDTSFVHVCYFKGDNRPCVVAVFTVDSWQGEPYNREPEKHDAVSWIDREALPDTLWPRHRRIIHALEQGMFYSDEYA